MQFRKQILLILYRSRFPGGNGCQQAGVFHNQEGQPLGWRSDGAGLAHPPSAEKPGLRLFESP
jgi:hypothetical protein